MPGTVHLCRGDSERILTAMGPLRIVLVDDHEMVLQGLTTILGRFLGRGNRDCALIRRMDRGSL